MEETLSVLQVKWYFMEFWIYVLNHCLHLFIVSLNPIVNLASTSITSQMQGMLNNPQFLQQMSSVLSNPAILDQIINSNPQLAAMGPQVRELFQSEQFRQMM